MTSIEVDTYDACDWSVIARHMLGEIESLSEDPEVRRLCCHTLVLALKLLLATSPLSADDEREIEARLAGVKLRHWRDV